MWKKSKTGFNLVISGLSFGLFIFGLSACQPAGHSRPNKPQENTFPIIDEELVSTTPDVSKLTTKEGLAYEAPKKVIKNKQQVDIYLDRVKMDKAKISYDPSTRKLSVSGIARVLDKNKKEAAFSEFHLVGEHAVDDNIFYLNPERKTKANSSEKPLVRAKVTCLNINNNNEFDCSRAVIDFFVAYKKEVFSEQMELVDKKAKTLAVPATAPAAPVSEPLPQSPTPVQEPQADAPQTDEPADDATKPELQAEGHDDSIDGRYEGHVETVDLALIFADDEAEDKVVPPTVAATPAPPVTPAEPAKPDVKKPEPPAVVKKDKPLSKDLLQTSSGDVRQINQAVGSPDGGRLRNSTNLLTKQQALNTKAYFEVANPARNTYYATYEMGEFITRLGESLNLSSNKKLFVSSVSKKTGGKLSPHVSHQIGLDADLGYPATQESVKFPVVVAMRTRQYNPSSFSVAKTYELFKYAFKQTDIKVDRIFADKKIKKALCDYATAQGEFKSNEKDLVENLFKNIQHVDGHGDHFHIRLKCSSFDPDCRQKLYAVNQGCS
jgi:murein endopeptidase